MHLLKLFYDFYRTDYYYETKPDRDQKQIFRKQVGMICFLLIQHSESTRSSMVARENQTPPTYTLDYTLAPEAPACLLASSRITAFTYIS